MRYRGEKMQGDAVFPITYLSIGADQPVAGRLRIVAAQEFFSIVEQLIGGQIAVAVTVKPAQCRGGFGYPFRWRSRSRSSMRRILPLMVLGNSLTNSISRGYL